MGAVWAATHVVTGKAVALKFLSDHAGDDSSKKRLLREARAACSVSHPNVVQVHDVLELDDGMPVLVMDLLRGESLGERLEREKTIAHDELVALLIPLASALEAAHAKGIVHRDIKPDNVFLAARPDGAVDVKVLDFGIAKVTKLEDGEHAETAKLTGTGAMMGTPYYMAPEQVFGEKDLDARTDLWSVGVLMYECLAGVRPTEGANLGQILKLVTVGPFKPLASVAPQVPAPLARVVDSCLVRDKHQRVASALALREALERVKAGTTLDGAEVHHEVSATPTPARKSRGRVFGALGAGATLLALLGFGVVRARSVPPEPPRATAGAVSSPAPPAPPAQADAPTAAPVAIAAAAPSPEPQPAADAGTAPPRSSRSTGKKRNAAPSGPRPENDDRAAGGVVTKAPF